MDDKPKRQWFGSERLGNASRKRPRFQFSLATAFVTMVLAGILLWANMEYLACQYDLPEYKQWGGLILGSCFTTTVSAAILFIVAFEVERFVRRKKAKAKPPKDGTN